MPSPEAIERNRQRSRERYWKVKAMREQDPELGREYHRVRLENERRRRRKNWQAEREKNRAYYLANRERILEYGRKYYHGIKNNLRSTAENTGVIENDRERGIFKAPQKRNRRQ